MNKMKVLATNSVSMIACRVGQSAQDRPEGVLRFLSLQREEDNGASLREADASR